MHVGCECNVVIATFPQRYLESTFLHCDNVAFTMLPHPKHNVVTMLSQRDFVCWVVEPIDVIRDELILVPYLRVKYIQKPVAEPLGDDINMLGWY